MIGRDSIGPVTAFRIVLFLLVVWLAVLTARVALAQGRTYDVGTTFDDDEMPCVCAPEVNPATGTVDLCGTGERWIAIKVDPPTILRVVRQAQALARMRAKLAADPNAPAPAPGP